MPKTLATKTNREDWLAAVAEGMRPWFAEAGYKLPRVRMAIGFPSSGRRGKALAECWTDKASRDGVHEIFIRPEFDEPKTVAGFLAHELVHAAVGIPAGHKAPFKKCALAIGLEGKMPQALPGDALKRRIAQLLKTIGPLPHGRLTAESEGTTKKKQTNRQLKCQCPTCGYTCRTTRKWLEDAGAPICPTDRITMEHEALDDAEDEGDGEE